MTRTKVEGAIDIVMAIIIAAAILVFHAMAVEGAGQQTTAASAVAQAVKERPTTGLRASNDRDTGYAAHAIELQRAVEQLPKATGAQRRAVVTRIVRHSLNMLALDAQAVGATDSDTDERKRANTYATVNAVLLDVCAGASK